MFSRPQISFCAPLGEGSPSERRKSGDLTKKGGESHQSVKSGPASVNQSSIERGFPRREEGEFRRGGYKCSIKKTKWSSIPTDAARDRWLFQTID